MKTLFALSALVALGFAGAASAQSTDVGGTAEAICSLPATFTYHSSTTGTSSDAFNGTTWEIDPAQFATANGAAATGGEIAMRVRGTGVCNTSHTFTISSDRGGLTAAGPGTGTASEAAPTGFTKRRPMLYEAYWVASGTSSSSVPLGPRARITADFAGEANTATYTVSPTLAPPGTRAFDIRMGMARGALTTGPLLAGIYSDTVRVTLSFQ